MRSRDFSVPGLLSVLFWIIADFLFLLLFALFCFVWGRGGAAGMMEGYGRTRWGKELGCMK